MSWVQNLMPQPPILADEEDFLDPDGSGVWASLILPRLGSFQPWRGNPRGQEPPKEKFVYTPLDQSRRQIRLMYLVGNRDSSKGAAVRASLKAVSLDSEPEYASLSYVWGNSEEEQLISLNDRAFAVRSNLLVALQQLQTRLGDGCSLPLWVDAVCINQRDELEKNAQVREMGAIYSRAKLVVAWLGPAADGSDVALEKLHRVGRLQLARKSHTQPSNSMSDLDLLKGFWYFLGAEFEKSFPVKEVNALLRRPYWYRIWIMQEAKLPPQVYCLCGRSVVPFSALVLGLEAMYHLWFLAESLGGPLMNVSGSQPLLSILTSAPSLMRSTFINPKVKQPLWRLLKSSNDRQATDKRDYVFGVLGIATDLELLGLEADYTKSCLEVYMSVAEAMICKQGEFGLLFLCGNMKARMTGLPSWAVDWSGMANPGITASVFPDDIYGAGGKGLVPRSRGTAVENGALCLDGVLVGKVDKVGPAANDFNHLGRYAEALEAFARTNCTAYSTAEELDDAIDRVTTLDSSQTPNASGIMPCVRAAGFAHALFGRIKANNTRDVVGVEEHYVMCHYNRRLFVTSNGLLGLGLESIRVGDLICVVPGCNMPLVLRRLSDGDVQDVKIYCTLIDNVFVQGIMDGEARQMKAAKTARFVIS